MYNESKLLLLHHVSLMSLSCINISVGFFFLRPLTELGSKDRLLRVTYWFDGHLMASPRRRSSTSSTRLEWTTATWYSLVHRGLLLADCCGTPRQWNAQVWSGTGDAFTCRLALARCGRSGSVQPRLHRPPMSARQGTVNTELPDRLLPRCIGYWWSS